MAPPIYALSAKDTQLVVRATPGMSAEILHWGPQLYGTPPGDIARMTQKQWVHGGPSVRPGLTLSNEIGVGNMMPPGLEVHRAGQDWALVLRVYSVDAEDNELRISARDTPAGVDVTYRLRLDPETGVVEAETALTNTGETALALNWCAALCLPLAPETARLRAFTGRWANEFQTEDVAIFSGSYVRENRRGRTSHDVFPGLLAIGPGASETRGEAAGFHLGWSGNHRLRVDRGADGATVLQMGELLLPGEIALAPGEAYRTPVLYAARSSQGLNAVSAQFHDHLTERIMDGRVRAAPRPVHFNSWEAVYFEHKPDRLMRLAEAAAAVGVERFVLDDGWFGSRRSDNAGLGDWVVSSDVYPDGLKPLADHVRSLGMQFGLWFEPEMVNEDSDLFRRHPDWALGVPGLGDIPSRNQRALDLSRPEVADYLFVRMSQVIADVDAAYIKWDMNRDLHHPASAGRACVHQQVRAVYALMDRLREAFPVLEIESCASGGARADYGVLARTDRIWTSDSNDAHDRQTIQRGASYFFPLAVSGAHVGPATCHTTGRRHSLAFRIASAFMGHMGLELDVSVLSKAEADELREGLALHKRHRKLLHGGKLHRVETGTTSNAVIVVARDWGEAILSWATLASLPTTHDARLKLTGLDPDRSYRIRQIWPTRNVSATSPSLVELGDLLGEGFVATGSALMDLGLQMPVMHPDTCLLFHLRAVQDSPSN